MSQAPLLSKVTKPKSSASSTRAAIKHTCSISLCAVHNKCFNEAPFSGGICNEHLYAAKAIVNRHNQARKTAEEAEHREKEKEDDDDKSENATVILDCEGCHEEFPEDDLSVFHYTDGSSEPLCSTCYEKAESKQSKELPHKN